MNKYLVLGFVLGVLTVATGVVMTNDNNDSTVKNIPVVYWDEMNDEQQHEAVKNGTAVLDTSIKHAIANGAITIDE